MNAVEAVEVTKKYKRSLSFAISNISLNIKSGRIFTLLGRNGAGKTTFVRICATQLLPTSGTITIFNHDLIRDTEKIRNYISIVPQEGRPLRALTPWDHVYYWLRIRGMDKVEAAKRTKKILLDFELYDVRNKLAMYLSGGMKQKILVAMAMATDSKLLFLDEPTIGLDPVSRRQIWKAIKEKKESGTTIMLTTHYMDEAEILSDDIVIIDKGIVVEQGTLSDIRKNIKENIKIEISKSGMDVETLKSYGSVVDTGADTLRLFTFESNIQELSGIAIKRNLFFKVSPITLDDVFVSLVGTEPNNSDSD
ncbi:MAG: ABC transporter ATP-binding protein [Thaumarchaeota archaeon]|nr:MAG: ABC transporter ATP-binding protein [Nitrososphaerota archaeon]TLX87850.1 MAG: ABC transporter ATP-binding protein [Nitrososphaerota archaeon]TLX91643.1 MAG: ABC transporter ATP-binding protein [Nitrososphaerota archaeon]